MFALRSPPVYFSLFGISVFGIRLFGVGAAVFDGDAIIKSVRTHEAPDYIRVVLDTSKASKYSIFALKTLIEL